MPYGRQYNQDSWDGLVAAARDQANVNHLKSSFNFGEVIKQIGTITMLEPNAFDKNKNEMN